MGKTRDFFKKIRDTKEIFHAKMGTIKHKNSKNLTETEEIKNIQKNYARNVLMIQTTTMVWSLTNSQTSWSVKSSRP